MATNQGGVVRTGATQFMNDLVLFDDKSASDVSPVIQVDGQPVIIRAHQMDVGEKLLVEMVDGAGEGKYFSPYMRNGCQVSLTRKCNQISIATPGRYRLILEGVVGNAFVNYFAASSTHDFLKESFTMSSCGEFPTTLPPSGSAGGALTGTYPNPDLNAVVAAGQLTSDENAKLILANALTAAINDPLKMAQLISANTTAQQILANALCDDLASCIATVVDGKIANINAGQLTDRISQNANALLVLANALCAPMQPCIAAAVDAVAQTPETIAAVFKRCDGTPHTPCDILPTCEEMQTAIDEADPKLLDCNAAPIAKYTQIATCEQVDEKIIEAVGKIPADKFLQDVEYDPVTHEITFKVANDGDTFTVNLSDLLPVKVADTGGLSGNGTVSTPLVLKIKPSGGIVVDGSNGAAVLLAPDGGLTSGVTGLALSLQNAGVPEPSIGTDIPTTIVGGRAQILGQPDGWLSISGKKIPYWN